MTPDTKFEKLIGKNVVLTIGTVHENARSEGTFVEYNAFGVLLELTNKNVLFYPWNGILNIDVSQAYNQLKVA